MPYPRNSRSPSDPIHYATHEERILYLLNFIITYKRLHGGISPTMIEMCQFTRRSKPTTMLYLASLEERGEITHIYHSRRGINVRGEHYECPNRQELLPNPHLHPVIPRLEMPTGEPK